MPPVGVDDFIAHKPHITQRPVVFSSERGHGDLGHVIGRAIDAVLFLNPHRIGQYLSLRGGPAGMYDTEPSSRTAR